MLGGWDEEVGREGGREGGKEKRLSRHIEKVSVCVCMNEIEIIGQGHLNGNKDIDK